MPQNDSATADRSRSSAGYEYLEHTADVVVHTWGPDLKTAFEQAVLALMNAMIENLDAVRKKVVKEIEMEAPDLEILLVDYLSEYLSIFDIEELLFSEVNIKYLGKNDKGDGVKIISEARGERFDPERHIPDMEVKAITFSYLKIIEKEDGAEIYVVFDL